MFGVAAVVLLSGCRASRVEQSPAADVKLPSAYDTTSSTDIAIDTMSMAMLSWDSFFTDTLLQHCIGEALANNHSFQQTLERVLIARAQLRQSRSQLFPSVSAGVQGYVQRFGDYTMDGVGNETTNTPDLAKDRHIPAPYREFQLGVSFQWEADVWGKLTQKKRAVAARWYSSMEAARLARTLLVSEVAMLYYELVGLDRQAEVLEHALAEARRSHDLTFELKQEGEETQLAVDQFHARVLQLQGMLLETKQLTEEKERALCTLMGRFPAPVKRCAFDSIEQLRFPSQIGIPAQLLQLRPDIREAEMELIAAKADVKAARKAFYPSLILGGSGGFNAFNLSKWFVSPASLVYDLGLGITAPIFNRAEIRSVWQASQSRERIALSAYHEAALKAYEEVSNLIVASDLTARRKQLKQEECMVNRRSVSNATEMFKLSFVGYLEVLSADERYLECELEQIVLSTEYCALQALLYRALGGGA